MLFGRTGAQLARQPSQAGERRVSWCAGKHNTAREGSRQATYCETSALCSRASGTSTPRAINRRTQTALLAARGCSAANGSASRFQVKSSLACWRKRNCGAGGGGGGDGAAAERAGAWGKAGWLKLGIALGRVEGRRRAGWQQQVGRIRSS